MIKEKEIKVKINSRNITYYKNKGYSKIEIGKESFIKTIDLTKGSKIKITAICKICSSENKIQYNKYLVNFNRNNKGFYSCFLCKNLEKKKTCLKK